MLERATVCLKAGLRHSLRPQNQQNHHKSHRSLHSAFWSHGAPDLDPPSWACSVLPAPPDLPMSSTSRSSASFRKQRPVLRPPPPASSATDGIFLDFLYPPQALAWLRRTNRQQLERWEKRNLRRLPEGFIQTSRGYSSRSRAHLDTDFAPGHSKEINPTRAVGPEYTSEEHNDGDSDLLHDTHVGTAKALSLQSDLKSDPESIFGAVIEGNPAYSELGVPSDTTEPAQGPQNPSELSEEDRTVQYQRSSKRWQYSTLDELVHGDLENREQQSNSSLGFADSPLDLAEATSNSELENLEPENLEPESLEPENPLLSLRGILSQGRAPRVQEPASWAWSLYQALDEDDRRDVRLKQELLGWFSSLQETTGDAHCISLYLSLPLADRALPTYRAAIDAFLRRRDTDSALGAHQEALVNIENGIEVTKYLFERAMGSELWDIALAVRTQHRRMLSSGLSQREALFWLNVSDMKDLIGVTQKYIQACFDETFDASDLNDHRQLASRMAEEALNIIAAQPLVRTSVPLPAEISKAVYRLIHAVGAWHMHAAKTLLPVLGHMLEHNKTEAGYAKAHNLISTVWRNYQKLPDVQPPEELLMLFLERLTRYDAGTVRHQAGHHSLTTTDFVNDWTRIYGQLSLPALHRLLKFHALRGEVQKVEEYWNLLKKSYPRRQDQKPLTWALVYVYARRCDLQGALSAFSHVQQEAAEFGEVLDRRCLSALILAQCQAGDTSGALRTFQKLLDAGFEPNVHDMHPILLVYAKRGEVTIVKSLLAQWEKVSSSTDHLSITSSLMTAYIRCGDTESAVKVLKSVLERRQTSRLFGRLTNMFNGLMTAHALASDMDSVMRVYRWMQSENVKMNELTYAAIMRAFARRHQTEAAHKVVVDIMARRGLQPMALHYAILIAGYVSQRKYDSAIRTYQKMIKQNIIPTTGCQRAYLVARAHLERHQKGGFARPHQDNPEPLTGAIEEMRRILRVHDQCSAAPKQPGFDRERTAIGRDVDDIIASVMFLHGRDRCVETMLELFQFYQSKARERGNADAIPPMRILTALMMALDKAGRFEEVEKYWHIAKESADKMAPTPLPPVFNVGSVGAEFSRATIVSGEEVPDAAAIGFPSSGAQSLAKKPPTAKLGARPAPNLAMMLTRPLRYYILTLFKQKRMRDMIQVCDQLLAQGYKFDIITWNWFVGCLCMEGLPLLAFTLTERYLMPGFPGWMRSMKKAQPRFRSRFEGSEYMRTKYLPSGKLMPRYRTMVELAGALVRLRRSEAAQGVAAQERQDGLQSLVGNEKLIRERAPHTVAAVESIPRVDDRHQVRALKTTRR